MYPFKEVEKGVKERWKKNYNLIKRSLEYDQKKPLFSFLEGPPTANAPPALHHIEVRVFKDLFCRFKYMQGYTVPRKGGWDCHGLPVEVQTEKMLKLNSKKDITKYGVSKFISECRKSVFSYIKEWNEMTERMGYWIDLEHPYITLTNDYIESVWWSLKELYNKGLLYEGHKVVPFCPRCETPLSSHEVAQGYRDVSEPSVVVKFRTKENRNRFFLAFTTTPWTLPSNLALAVHADAEYAIVQEKGEEYILAKAQVSKYFKQAKIIGYIKGKQMEGKEYEPIFDYFIGKLDKKAWFVITSDTVTLDEGTGIVHMAPAFGEVDYDECKKNNLPFVQPVSEDGKFTSDVSDWKGTPVKAADPKIIEHLKKKEILFVVENYTHSYPFCWRCSTPLIYYAMTSWFVRTTSAKEKMMALNKKIKWYPSHIKEGRFGDWLENMKDWALSRKKFWGTPLPIWRCECGHEIIIGSKDELKQHCKQLPKDLDLHKPAIDSITIQCSRCKKTMKRLQDVIDCWYDSGSAPFAQLHYPFENKDIFKKFFPYDFIAEAIDQTRGWFYTLHALSALLFDNMAYKTVVCAGHVVDEKGEKMSKSKGNIINPLEVFDTVGVDAVRIQMCMTEPGESKRFSVRGVNESVIPSLTILWNCYIFSKENIKKNKKHTNNEKLEIEDEWLISRTNTIIRQVTDHLEKHEYHHCMTKIMNFINEDLSRFYIRLIRDRLASQNKSAISSLSYAFDNILKLLAPFAVHTADYIYYELFEKDVHFESWPKPGKINVGLEKEMDITRSIITAILAERDKVKIGIRWPLSHVEIMTSDRDVQHAIGNLDNLIKNQVNIKKIIFNDLKPSQGSLTSPSGQPVFITLDTHLTPELEKEGYVREITRRIQEMRKNASLKKEEKIMLYIETTYDIKEYEKEIREKVGAMVVNFGKAPKTEWCEGVKIKNEQFVIAFKKS